MQGSENESLNTSGCGDPRNVALNQLLRQLLQRNFLAAGFAPLEMSLKLVFYTVHKESINRTASILLDAITIHRTTSELDKDVFRHPP